MCFWVLYEAGETVFAVSWADADDVQFQGWRYMSVVGFVFVVFMRLGVVVFLFVGFVSLAWTWDEMLHKCSWISHFLFELTFCVGFS